MAELKQDLACVGVQLGEEAGASGTHEAQDASGGLFTTLLRAIRAVFAALFRLFGGGRHDPSMQREKRQALEERRALIRERIAAREDAERQWEENMQQVRHAADAVQEAAAAVRLTASSPDAAAAMLLEWQERRTEGLIGIDNQMKDWEALQQILGEGTLDEACKEGRNRPSRGDIRCRSHGCRSARHRTQKARSGSIEGSEERAAAHDAPT